MGGLALGSDFIMHCDGGEYANPSGDALEGALVYRIRLSGPTEVELCTPTGTVTTLVVFWGDGTAPQDVSTSSRYTHEYADAGVYDISIFNASGATAASQYVAVSPAEVLVEIRQMSPDITTIEQNNFRYCSNLTTVNLFPHDYEQEQDPRPAGWVPESSNRGTLTRVSAFAFAECSSLRYLYGVWSKVRYVGTCAFVGAGIETRVPLEYLMLSRYGDTSPAVPSFYKDSDPCLPIVPVVDFIDCVNEVYAQDMRSRVMYKAGMLRHFAQDFPLLEGFGLSGFWDGFSFEALGKASADDQEGSDMTAVENMSGLRGGMALYFLGSRKLRRRMIGGALTTLTIYQATDSSDLREPFGADSLGATLVELNLSRLPGMLDFVAIGNLSVLETFSADSITSVRSTMPLPSSVKTLTAPKLFQNGLTFVAGFEEVERPGWSGTWYRITVVLPFRSVTWLRRWSSSSGWSNDAGTYTATTAGSQLIVDCSELTASAVRSASVTMDKQQYTWLDPLDEFASNYNGASDKSVVRMGSSLPTESFAFPWGAPTTTVFKCSDYDIKYQNGAWTNVAKS